MRTLIAPALVVGFFVSGCGGPVTKDWTPEQRAAAARLGIQAFGVGAQGALANWGDDDWRQFGHVGISAMTDLALRFNAPLTAESIAQMDLATVRALGGSVADGLPGGDSDPGLPPSATEAADGAAD